MSTQIGDQIDPRMMDDRLHAIEDRIERLSDADRYQEAFEQAESNTRRARRAANVARAATMVVLFIAVVSIGVTLRSNHDLRWEIVVERSRAESLAKRVGDLSLQLARTRTELDGIQQRLIKQQAPNDTLASQADIHTADVNDLLANAQR